MRLNACVMMAPALVRAAIEIFAAHWYIRRGGPGLRRRRATLRRIRFGSKVAIAVFAAHNLSTWIEPTK